MDTTTVKRLAALLALLCASSGVAYAAILITSNQVVVTPEAPPTLLLAVSDTAPYVGDTITLTATLSVALSGITVTFALTNGTTIAAAVTSLSGVASTSYTIVSTETLTIEASCTL